MNDSTFNPETFLSQQFDTALETEYKPVPVGVYQAVLVNDEKHEMQARRVESEKARDGYFTAFEIWAQIDAPGNDQADGKHVRFDTFLDISPSGGLESGENRNVKLGQLRNAVGQNQPGVAWGFGMLVGQVLQIKVSHQEAKDGRTFARIDAVAPIGAALA